MLANKDHHVINGADCLRLFSRKKYYCTGSHFFVPFYRKYGCLSFLVSLSISIVVSIAEQDVVVCTYRWLCNKLNDD